MILTKEVEIGGRTITFETGKMAKQADGSVLVRHGDTVVLVSAVAARTPREGVSFLPLTVDYREGTYAAGKIPGGFFRREGRPNEKEVLTSRMIDRPLRPLFPDGWNFETQIIGMLLSSDQANDSDVLAITGASCALALSDIPFPGPIGAVRVGLTPEGEFLINPTFPQLETSRLNLVVAGSDDAIVMVEAGAKEVDEESMLEALFRGHDAIRKLVAAQRELAASLERSPRPVPDRRVPDGLAERISAEWKSRLAEAMRIPGKLRNYAAVDALRAELLASFTEDAEDEREFAGRFWHDLQDSILHEEILERGIRLDGRRFDEIRPITSEVGVLPRTHGSALFTRGETQALVTVTLGTSGDAQRLDFVEGESTRRFIMHYNFPPFSVGEARFLRGPGRREIGHGALAERSLLPLVPGEAKWPYTLRVVSDILESNGSSSMATVCGASLALMDAGVPIGAAVAGIAMGLVKAGDRAVVLSDIAGAEDHHGDMDFKVAGTARGITGLQMDIKIAGISREILRTALAQARQGRLEILEKMNQALEAPRAALSRYAPRILTITIDKDKIREVIGPGGKVIRSITERTGCKIDIHDDGRIDIASTDEAAAQQALEIIRELTAEAELGKTYVGKVIRVVNFGAFVEILPGVEGLVHISEITNRRLADVREELNEGDETVVKVVDIDAQGRVRLSRRVALQEQGLLPADPIEPVGVSGPGDDDRGGGRGRGARPAGRPGGPGRPHRGGSGGGHRS